MHGFLNLLLALLIGIPLSALSHSLDNLPRKCELYFNTGNELKWREMSQLMEPLRLARLEHDLDEIQSEHIDVVVHKASQFDNKGGNLVFVEDSSLEIEGADFGINVKWQVHKIGEQIGKRATWISLLAYRIDDHVNIYRGEVSGTIVDRRGPGDGFTPYFLPDGHTQTIAEMSKPLTARKRAVMAFLKGEIYERRAVISEWNGEFQSGNTNSNRVHR